MPIRSYIKIYGPPVLAAINGLEKLATDMPEVCIMDTIIYGTPNWSEVYANPSEVQDYFNRLPGGVAYERCDSIISEKGEMLGEYDFFFEWFKEPTMDELNEMIKNIDEVLTPLGCKYTITTK
ncbi:MAG: hypothetical protein ACLFVP_04710 [Candidatus Bathyarchaeia archaeon]